MAGRVMTAARRPTYVLYGGGFGQTLLQDQAPASTTLESVGDPGPGRWVTIYANAGHAYIEVAGIYFDTAAGPRQPAEPAVDGTAVEHRRDRAGRLRRTTSTRSLIWQPCAAA